MKHLFSELLNVVSVTTNLHVLAPESTSVLGCCRKTTFLPYHVL